MTPRRAPRPAWVALAWLTAAATLWPLITDCP